MWFWKWLMLFGPFSLFSANLAVSAERTRPEQCLESSEAVAQSTAYLQAMTATPTPPFVPIQAGGEAKFIATAQLFQDIMGMRPPTIILNSLEELRFLPYTLARSQLLLVIKSDGHWTADKTKKVLAVAKTSQIAISILWLSESPASEDVKAISLQSQGQFFRSADLVRRVMDHFCSQESLSIAGR